MVDLEVAADDAVPRNRACDLCFSKKIKCDRENPCANCLAATAACRRDRPRRRIKNTAQNSIQRRFESSEYLPNWRRSLSPRGAVSTNSAPRVATSARSVQQTTRLSSAEPQPERTPASHNGRQSFSSSTTERGPATTQAQSHIQAELQNRSGMDNEKRDILKSALTFATHASVPMNALVSDDYSTTRIDISDETLYPSAETLHFILNSPRKESGLCFILDMSSVVSPTTLAKQGFELIEKRAFGATGLQYVVNVNFVAWVYLSASSSDTVGPTMQKHLDEKRKQYEQNILVALHRIGVLDNPSLSLFQALLSGVMYMLLSGKLEKCWQLNAAASRICTALGGYSLISSLPAQSVESQEARYSVSLCYMFDKALASSMNRTTCLPEMDLNISELMPSNPSKPYTSLVHVYLQLAEVQNEIVFNSRRRKDPKNILEIVQTMQQNMWKIKENIREFRNISLHSQDSYLRGEWMGADFAYHSVMTSIVRLHPYIAEDGGLHQQLLGYARTSLTCLHDMLAHGKTLDDMHNFSVSVSWLVLFYPLYPFFVLFTHAVSASSIEDFQLLSKVTTDLEGFAGQNSALTGVQRLFEGFMTLCRPIFNQECGPSTLGGHRATQSVTSNSNLSLAQPRSQEPQHLESAKGTSPRWTNPFPAVLEDGPGPNWSAFAAQETGPIPGFGTLDEHDLLAELYSAQPSIGWIDGGWPS